MPCKSEKEIYNRLGMDYIPPELRKNRVIWTLPNRVSLPMLVSQKDIRGDFHIHSTYSDGYNSIDEMVSAAQDRGYEYIAITDHTPSARIAKGMSEETIQKQ
jgi:DNA polymerase (family 10)